MSIFRDWCPTTVSKGAVMSFEKFLPCATLRASCHNKTGKWVGDMYLWSGDGNPIRAMLECAGPYDTAQECMERIEVLYALEEAP